MLLPEPLFEAIRHHMGDHGDWHIARYRERWLPLEERSIWRRARNKYPELFYLDEAGAGKQFLDFHRLMIRHYKWILANTPGHGKSWYVWTRVPAIYMQRIPSHIRNNALTRIEAMITDASITADQLGSFIERTKLDTSPGSDLHTALHGAINNVESKQYPNHHDLYRASMADLSHAHYNEHFWILHGWIDNIYARWQAAHGLAVEQDALDPSAGLHHVTPPGNTLIAPGGGAGTTPGGSAGTTVPDGHNEHADHAGHAGHGGGGSTAVAGGGVNSNPVPILEEPKPTPPVAGGIGFHHDPILHDTNETPPPKDPSGPHRPHNHH